MPTLHTTRTTLLLLAALLLPGALTARAACTLSIGGSLINYVPTQTAATTAIGTITVNCTALSGLGGMTLALSTGTSGTYTNRRMTKSSYILNYQIYTDSTYTTIWGDGSGGTSTVAGISTLPLLGGTQTFSAYIKITPLQNDAAGTYVDNPVTVTLTY